MRYLHQPSQNVWELHRNDSGKMTTDATATIARPTPSYQCSKLDQGLRPAARLDRSPWKEATWIDDFKSIHTGEALTDDRYLQAAVLWDDAGLYVGFRSAPSLVPVTRVERDSDLWNECAVELFLAAGAGYYEIEINPLGAVLDLYFPDEEADDWKQCSSWDAEGMTWAVRSTGRPGSGVAGWEAELSLPWSAVPLMTRDVVEGDDVIWAQLCRSTRCTDGTLDRKSVV